MGKYRQYLETKNLNELPVFRNRHEFEKGDRVFYADQSIWGRIKKILKKGMIRILPDNSNKLIDVLSTDLLVTAQG